jgi:hypothetical protein
MGSKKTQREEEKLSTCCAGRVLHLIRLASRFRARQDRKEKALLALVALPWQGTATDQVDH